MATNKWQGTTTNPATAGNWSGGVPTANDDVNLPDAADFAVAGGDLATGVTISTLSVDYGFGQTIGSKSAYLQFDVGGTTKTVVLNNNTATYLDIDTATLITVNRAAVGSTTEKGLSLVGASNTELDIKTSTGSIGLASRAGETFACTTINIYGGKVEIGSGVTCTNLNIFGGTVTNYTTIATCTMHGGVLDDRKGCTTLNPYGGRYIWTHTAAITTMGTIKGATIDLSSEETVVTVTNKIIIAQGTINDPYGRLADGLIITPDNADITDDGVKIKLGKGRKITLGTA